MFFFQKFLVNIERELIMGMIHGDTHAHVYISTCGTDNVDDVSETTEIRDIKQTLCTQI